MQKSLKEKVLEILELLECKIISPEVAKTFINNEISSEYICLSDIPF